jgi:hypothetical protein
MQTTRRIILVLLVLSLAIGGVTALIAFSQVVPDVPNVPKAIVVANCNSLVLEDLPSSSNGILHFDCGGGSAFSVNNPTSQTATFTLTTGWTGISLTTNGACIIGLVSLKFATPQTLAVGNYDYCIAYDLPGGGTLPGFSIAWA